jgi:hypothetical protein
MRSTFSPLEKRIMKDVSSDFLMQHTNEIAKYVRISGSEDEAKSLEYVKKTLRSYGLKVKEYLAETYVGYPESAWLDVTEPETRRIGGTSNALAPSTPTNGTQAEILYLGSGDEEAFSKASVEGKLLLLEGLAEPEAAHRADINGAAGEIFINDTHAHEGIVSVVWGTPRAETAQLLPRTPCISITRRDGEYLKDVLKRGRVSANLCTRTWRGWRKIPVVTADVPGKLKRERFTMVSGHIDSWHYGAMDNGTANAAMLEVARLMTKYKNHLRRGVRIAFWSGHSHGRYAGSTWYADNFWLELQKKCVAHVNVDGLGGRGATILSEAPVMASARDFTSAIIEKIANQKLTGQDLSRAGDQSFIGIGMPSIFIGLSEVPNDATEPIVLFRPAPSGSGWWWHTAEDTPDKIDPKNLVRDTQVYALVTLGLCSADVLPFDYRRTTEEIKRTLLSLNSTAKGIFDLRSLIRQADELSAVLDRFYRVTRHARIKRQFEVVNDALVELGHILVPITHSSKDRFDHEFAVPVPMLPCLRDLNRLAKLDKESDEFKFLRNGLRRESNRVAYALDRAIEVIERASNDLK